MTSCTAPSAGSRGHTAPGAARVMLLEPVRVADDTQVWADTYERQLDEIFTVQADIATQVSQQLGAIGTGGCSGRLIEAPPTANLDAYKEYLRGSFLVLPPGRPARPCGRVAVLRTRGAARPGVCEGTCGGRVSRVRLEYSSM